MNLEVYRKFIGPLTTSQQEELDAWLAVSQSEERDRNSPDAKDFGPYWLEGIQGSLAEERRQNHSKRDSAYNQVVRKARRDSRKRPLSALKLLTQPDELDIKLSELWARYPSTEITFRLDLQKLTKSNSRLLRSVVLYFYYHRKDFNKYYCYLFEEELDRVLEDEEYPKNPKTLKEIKIFRKLFIVLGDELAIQIIESLYRKSNLDRWQKTAESLLENYQVVEIPYIRVKEKVRRRGYRESHSNKHKSKDQRGEVAMSREAQELEEIKQRIQLKQAILFEKRLDDYLKLEDPDFDLSERRRIFNSLLDPNQESDEDLNHQGDKY